MAIYCIVYRMPCVVWRKVQSVTAVKPPPIGMIAAMTASKERVIISRVAQVHVFLAKKDRNHASSKATLYRVVCTAQ